jgi:hypothetical protein
MGTQAALDRGGFSFFQAFDRPPLPHLTGPHRISFARLFAGFRRNPEAQIFSITVSQFPAGFSPYWIAAHKVEPRKFQGSLAVEIL